MKSTILFYHVSLKTKRTEKPMQPSDYRRIENELQQQIRQASIAGVPGESLNRKGWSTGYLGLKFTALFAGVCLKLRPFTDDSDDEFHAFESSSPEKVGDYGTSSHHPISSGP